MTQRLLVLKSQKDVMFNEIKEAGLDPASFAWTDVPSKLREDTTVSKLEHSDSGFYFLFDHGRDSAYGSHSLECHPGHDIPVYREYSGGWETLKQSFLTWLRSVKREQETPDLWSQLANEPALIAVVSSLPPGNEPLTATEQSRISDAVGEIRAYLKERETVDEQRWSAVDEKLDSIIDASQRLGRKDWVLLTIGSLVSIFVSGAFAPEQAAAYFQVAMNIFRLALEELRMLSAGV
jgi:hypothetical protein